ncbi:ca84e27b-45c9-41fc-8021-de7600c3dcf5 [Sclerotinia trifoliorum]|uniref:Ca84e27b-45c9-41fc-8021-de7600c3dcf5 n=1 Tax=Sclerotinia trifoliorum TaxID=28548 RepID=A0A8H2W5C7_9HELO|nr:ca84e27b-45c9-41fc-8021-de7600c3dcf5 [Sclerotinia trifoliorum]
MSEEETAQTYPVVADNAINRHKERGNYDVETVHSIFNSTPVAHVSFIPDPTNPAPVVLPMIARVGQFPGDENPACYVHGYVSTRLFKVGQKTGQSDGIPMCIAATKVVNLVLALTPFNHSYDYRSAIIHGRATLLDPNENTEENIWAMKLITDGIVPERWDNSRVPPDKGEITSTRILKVHIESASAKIRDSGVKDDKKDLNNPEVRGKIWTGVIPYVETLGTPIPNETNMVTTVPAYITEHIKEHNKKAGGGEAGNSFVSRVVGSMFGA